jgi:tripartite-type tricarboxylate transporter receptor subunit TctC
MRKGRLTAISVTALVLAAACGQSGDDNGGQTASAGAPAAGEWPGSLAVYIPAAPGGGFDIAVRALQEPLADELGASVVPTNVEGAGGSIAATEMLGLPADGTSAMIVSRSISALPYTGSPEIDPVEDLAPLGVTHQDVSALTVPADAPYQTVDDFIQYAKDNPGGVTIGHSGVGGVWHAAALMLARENGVEFSFVPYDGGSAVGAALLAGEIDAMTIGAPETRPFVEGGDATMLAVMGEERSALYPDVPTLIEEGIDVTYSVWRGYVTSAETPDDVRMELSKRLEAAAASDANQEAMTTAGFETTWIGPEEFGALIVEEDELIRELFEGEDFMTTMPERLAG